MRPLKTYRCVATVTGGKYLGEVKARSKAEAIELAWNLGTAHVSLCHQCDDEISDPEITDISVDVDDDAGDEGSAP